MWRPAWNAALSLGSGGAGGSCQSWLWQCPSCAAHPGIKSSVGKYLLASALNTARLLDCLISGAWFKSKAISLLAW